jgi:hypothetical protein
VRYDKGSDNSAPVGAIDIVEHDKLESSARRPPAARHIGESASLPQKFQVMPSADRRHHYDFSHSLHPKLLSFPNK